MSTHVIDTATEYLRRAYEHVGATLTFHEKGNQSANFHSNRDGEADYLNVMHEETAKLAGIELGAAPEIAP